MALLDVNLKDVSLEGPPQLPPGVYTLLSKSATLVPAAEGKAAAVDIVFKNANDETDMIVRKRFSLGDKAKVYLKRWLLSCKRLDLANATALDTEDLIGLTGDAVVSERQYVSDSGEHGASANIDRFIIPEDMKAAMKAE